MGSRPQKFVRREDARLVSGRGYFVSDVAVLGMLHAAFVRSPHAHAKVLAISTEDALSHEGVSAVLTESELGALRYPMINPLIADAKIATRPLLDGVARYVGQPMLVVVASSMAQARAAAESVIIDWQILEPDVDFSSELAEATQSSRRDVFDFKIQRAESQVSNPLATGRTISVETQQRLPRLSAAPLESRAAVAVWTAETASLTLWLPTQTPSRAQADLASILGLQKEKIRVIAPDVGGAFGARASIYTEDILLAASARFLCASLKWTGSRSEEFLSAMQGRGSELKMVLDISDAGQLQSIKARLDFPMGAWMPFSALAPARNATKILPGFYKVDTVQITGRGYTSHSAPINIYRGAGRPEATLMLELAIEKAARALAVDPMQLRRQCIHGKNDFPLRLPSGAVIDSADPLQLLDRAELLFDYSAMRKLQALSRQQQGLHDVENYDLADELVGIGAALYVEPCGEGWESARLSKNTDGSFLLATGSTAQGQGRESAYAAIVAQFFNVDAALVQVRHGDTAQCPEGIGALASRGTPIGASAVLQACRELQQKLAANADTPNGQTVEVKYVVAAETWSSGCVIVQVRIKRATGELRIDKVVWVDDAGHLLNPTLVKGQLLGGMAQGIGQALMERIAYDDWGQLITGSFMDYAMPRASDIPNVILESICTPTDANLLGAKGVGEAGCIGIPAAILNAALDAVAPLGIQDLDFPLTSARIWEALNHHRLT